MNSFDARARCSPPAAAGPPRSRRSPRSGSRAGRSRRTLTSPVFAGHAGDGTQPALHRRAGRRHQGAAARRFDADACSSTSARKLLAGGERGLLGLAFHPQLHSQRPLLRLLHARGRRRARHRRVPRVGQSRTSRARAETVLLTIPHPTSANHNGGMLAFGPDGYLYIGVGDGGSRQRSAEQRAEHRVAAGQDPAHRRRSAGPAAGTLYSSPADNPYFGAAPGRDEIFSIGWRNPVALQLRSRGAARAVGRPTWARARAKKSTRRSSKAATTAGASTKARACTGIDPVAVQSRRITSPPLFEYTHAGGRCSITGGYVYRGAHGALPDGTYVYGDYCTGEIFAWDGASQTFLSTISAPSSQESQ